MMAVKPGKRKIELGFMDCYVKLEGHKDIEQKALKILGSLIQDRLKILEVMQELDHDDGESCEIKPKKNVINYDTNLSFYQ